MIYFATNDTNFQHIPHSAGTSFGTDANRRCEREQSANMFGICRAARRRPIGKLSAIELARIAEVRMRRALLMTVGCLRGGQAEFCGVAAKLRLSPSQNFTVMSNEVCKANEVRHLLELLLSILFIL